MVRKEAKDTIIYLAERNCSEYIRKIGRRTIVCNSWEDLLIVYDHLYLHELRMQKFPDVDFRYRIGGKRLRLRTLSKKKLRMLLSDEAA